MRFRIETMKMPFVTDREQGLTMLELLVIIAVVALLAIMVYPGGERDKKRALQVRCMSDLRQVGLGFHIWAGDQEVDFPNRRSTNYHGTEEFTSGPDAFRHFQVASNELNTPNILFCAAESDRNRSPATNFINFGNSNISYFVGLSATEFNPNTILAGDRNVTNGTPLMNGVLELNTNHPAGWTSEMHNKVGNIVLADGSVQLESGIGLQATMTNTPAVTNRLLMPVLGP